MFVNDLIETQFIPMFGTWAPTELLQTTGEWAHPAGPELKLLQ